MSFVNNLEEWPTVAVSQVSNAVVLFEERCGEVWRVLESTGVRNKPRSRT